MCNGTHTNRLIKTIKSNASVTFSYGCVECRKHLKDVSITVEYENKAKGIFKYSSDGFPLSNV
jgi:hypothetical protein